MAIRLVAMAAVLLPVVSPAAARVFLTMDEALALAFPDCHIERRTVFLTDAQSALVEELTGTELPSAMVAVYEATRDSALVGTAYFDSHRVRTLPQAIMVVIGPEETVQRVELLSFDEPADYVPREGWYGQYVDKKLDGELNLDRAIRGVTGATLTARATTEAVRRVLALHQVLTKGQEP